MTVGGADLRTLRRLVAECRRAVVFTGAGISTESGIPDFRSPGGICSRHTPIDFRDFLASEDARRAAWRLKFLMDRDVRRGEPNRGHRAVAALVRRGIVSAVITQNVDGLHQKASLDPLKVIELHGNGTYAKCVACKTRYEIDPIREAFEREERVPYCDACGAPVKAATISFGQAISFDQAIREAAIREAKKETLASALFLAVGSSLVVYPAAGFPLLAKENGAKLAIINRDPTDPDDYTDLVINSKIGPVLGEVAEVN
ncbi:MAG: NAD-dependent deacetylase [Alphaproteobacteria bacterium]|nr:NAD-dependent deacetylase [Alphaproteobacteria bacterium]